MRTAPAAITYSGQLTLVRQTDANGCGFACYAMVAGVSYAKAKAFVRRVRPKSTDVTSYLDLHTAMAASGLASTLAKPKTPFTSWKKLPDRAIVAINRGDGKQGWHWVVFDRVGGVGFVLDPECEEPRRDFRRMVGRGFIEARARQ